mgnify:CR=1 FL=1
MWYIKLLGHLIIIILLTVFTQIGGLIWIFALLLSVKLKKKKRYIFPVLYLIFNILIVPPIAKQFGREQLPVLFGNVKPRNIVYPLLFRNYVTCELRNVLENSSENLKQNHIKITYLDANFPFMNGFPLLPHLSHNDGNKIDISFMYIEKNGRSTNKKPSISGYGAYINSELNYTSNSCLENGYWQYDFPKYLTFGTIHDLKLDKKSTTALIKEFLSKKSTQKIFIEPHLKASLGLNSEEKIRFHGCQAVRHDDHIHLQVK